MHVFPQRKEIPVCRQAICRQCGKTTWAGCGQHVDQVMKGVPGSQRCSGHSAPAKGDAASGGPLTRLFGRG